MNPNADNTPAGDPTDPTDPTPDKLNLNADDTNTSDHEPETTGNHSELFGPSDDALAAEYAKYAKSLREEFERNPSPEDRAAENVERFTRDFFKKHIASAAAQIVWLSANSTSDSVRLRACQVIVKEALADARADGDGIKDLLKDLMIDPNSPQFS
jgi:hypothetical protein